MKKFTYKGQEMKNTKKGISILLACVAVGCLITAVVLWICHSLQDARAEKNLEELRSAAQQEMQEAAETASPVVLSTAAPTAQASDQDTDSIDSDYDRESPEPAEEPADEEEAPTLIPNPYADSFLANSDMAAWLVIPDTVIDYPVMWTPGDETYYLRRDFQGNSDQNGCLLLDTDSCLDPLTTNLIIHGHNMRSGAMFGTLLNYEDEAFYEQHKRIILYTEACQRNYEVIAVFRSQVFKKSDQVFKFYNFFQADTEEEFEDFYQNIKEMSQYDTGITAEFGDHFITLSTCAYHVEQGRFVVVAKEVETGDAYLPLQEESPDNP